MRERVLELSLVECVDFFGAVKHKLYSVDYDAKAEKLSGLVRVEIPRYEDESYIVELPFVGSEQLRDIELGLKNSGFIKQTVRVRSTF